MAEAEDMYVIWIEDVTPSKLTRSVIWQIPLAAQNLIV